MEEAAHLYNAAAMAYAAGVNIDTNFPPTPAGIATLGQPVLALECSAVLLRWSMPFAAPCIDFGVLPWCAGFGCMHLPTSRLNRSASHVF